MYLYSMHGQQLAGQFSLGSEAAREGVLDCIIYGDGLVALTGSASIPSKAISPYSCLSGRARNSREASQCTRQRAFPDGAVCTACSGILSTSRLMR